MSMQTEVQRIYDETKRLIYAEINRQGGTKDVLEVRHLEKIDRILDAASLDEADRLAKRAYDSVFLTCLHLRAIHKLTAKTPEEYRKKADRAESFAQMLWNQYIDSVKEPGEQRAKRLMRYERQTDRVRNLREYASRLALDPNLPSFDELYKAEENEPDEPVVEEKKPKKEKKPTVSMKPSRRRKGA